MRPSSLLIAPALLAALAVSTAALAQGPGGRPGGPRGGDFIDSGMGMGLNIFFSPSGQPFRAEAGQPYPVAAWFKAADTDHDGKISHDEFVADATRFFDELDINHDGYINSPENSRYENEIAPEIQRTDPRIRQPANFVAKPDADMDPSASEDQGGDGQSDKYIKQIIGASQYALIDEPQPVRAADANFDFRVSKAEWLAATQQRFSILDRNQDGFITLDELPHTPAQLAIESPGRDSGKKRKKHF